MPELSASFLTLTIDPFYAILLFLLATGVVVLGVIGWTVAMDRIQRARCRNWPKVPAIVDIVSVATLKPDAVVQMKPASTWYRATLTYTYHYPDEQMGDYSRDFGSKETAESWANSYKGDTVTVR